MLQSTPELPVPRDPGLDLLYDVLTAGGSDALHLGRGVHPAGGTRALHSQAGNEAANRATLRTMFMFEAGTGDWEVCERCLEQESCTEKSLE